MAKRILGIETEYGFSRTPGSDPDLSIDMADLGQDLVNLAMKRYPFLPAEQGHGLFLGNGARFYIDCGAHPEFCTPEVDNPWDLVCYVDAGSEILQDLAGELAREQGGSVLRLFRSNVDYVSGATWACHENYGHRTNPLNLPMQIVPHLVSRVIYSGAGGLNQFSHGIEFCLSPRVYHLGRTSSESSTSGRGIYHFKDESLSARGWHRLHVLCGDSLCSHLGTWLKVGTTALVVALVEGGFRPGQAVGLQDPVRAMRRFNRDLTMSSSVLLINGRRMTALDLQWHYLRFVRAHLGHPCLPLWAEVVCAAWQEMLEQLAQGTAGVRTRIDWAIKHALYLEHLRQRQVTPDELAAYNQFMRLTHPGTDTPFESADTSDNISDTDEEEGSRQTDKMMALSSAQQRKIQLVRAELCELDLRFGQLGPQGLFAALDRTGLLQHHLPDITAERLRLAQREPPQSGRAKLRGHAVQQLHGRGHHSCDWQYVWAGNKEALLDLSDPLRDEMPPWTRSLEQGPDSGIEEMDSVLDLVTSEYERGNFEQAFVCLGGISGQSERSFSSNRRRYFDMLALVQCRRGFFTAAFTALNARARARLDSIASIYEFVAIHRFQGLVPGDDIWEWIRLGDALLDQHPEPELGQTFAYCEHKGCALMQRGRLDEAKILLEKILAETERRVAFPRVFALATADLGEVYRRLGDLDQARICLDEAECFQTCGMFFGDLSEFTLLSRAKLEFAKSDVSRLLDRAEGLQVDANNRMGLARTLLLKARLLPGEVDADAIKERVLQIREQLPSLQACPKCTEILDAWEYWCAGRPHPEGGDSFWGI